MTTATSSPASCAARYRANRVYEDEHALAFHDINPLAPTHILVIPKGAYVSWDDFSARAARRRDRRLRPRRRQGRARPGLVAPGYRLLANVGANGGQEVPHLHVHIFGGRGLGPMLSR